MAKYILFEDGVLFARFDDSINSSIPPGAIEVDDDIFFQTINDCESIWKLIEGEIVATERPSLSIEEIRQSMKVTSFQAHAAVARAGLYDEVTSLIENELTPIETKLAWNKAQTFERLSPAILTMGVALGLSDEQLDDLFNVAKTIEA